jgi:hypothetical protein
VGLAVGDRIVARFQPQTGSQIARFSSRMPCEDRLMDSQRESRLMQTADSIYGWRYWILIPLAAVLILVPMPAVVRIMVGVIYGALLFVPFTMRVVGNFMVGWRS